MTGSLERRYRRLIALYPAAHRSRYQKEMLSTLLDGASANQRAPRIRESIDLVWNAFWWRLGRDGAPPVRDQRWAGAAAIFGVLGALVIAALHVMVPLGRAAWDQKLAEAGMPHDPISWIPFAQGAVWLAVAVVALFGRRRAAAIAGWAAVLGTAAWALAEYPANPEVLVREWALIVFGVTVAGCLSLVRGQMPLRARHVTVFAMVTAACAGSMWVDVMLVHVQVYPGGAVFDRPYLAMPSLPGIDTVGPVQVVLLLAWMAVTVWLQYKVDPGVRRRLRAYAWVPLATYALVRWAYAYYLPNPMVMWQDSAPLTAGQWAALILVPLVAYGTGVVVVRRKDSQQRLAEIGQAHP
jgi:hypothetical protein